MQWKTVALGHYRLSTVLAGNVAALQPSDGGEQGVVVWNIHDSAEGKEKKVQEKKRNRKGAEGGEGERHIKRIHRDNHQLLYQDTVRNPTSTRHP